MAKSGSVAADRLKSFIERIENLREEKKAIGSDERDVFSEAKGVGFDAKAMREVLRRRAMDASDRDEWDTLIDTYEHALGARGEAARIVASGGTYDEAAAKTGVGRATVARTVAGIKNLENETPAPPAIVDTDLTVINEPPHDPETGVIIETTAGEGASQVGESQQCSSTTALTVAAPSLASPEREARLATNSDAAPRLDHEVPTPQPLSEGGDGIGHQIEMTPQNGAADAAKPVTAQAAAPPEVPPIDPWIAADEARARLDESKRAKGFA